MLKKKKKKGQENRKTKKLIVRLKLHYPSQNITQATSLLKNE